MSPSYSDGHTIKTNIYGAENVIGALLEKNVKKVIALSTDKYVACPMARVEPFRCTFLGREGAKKCDDGNLILRDLV